MTKRGSTAERALRRIESASARRCDAITTLTSSAIPELARRHGTAVADKATVVTTCVDLDRFTHSPMPDLPLRLLLSGTFNPLYDVDTMLRFAQHVRDARPESSMTLLRPGQSRLDRAVQDAGGVVSTSGFSEMPAQVASHHAGLSICRSDEPTAIIAAMPTKIGEFLACGRPVVANAGLGDVEALLGNSGAGVVLHGTSDRELSGAAHQLIELIDDRATPARCRRVAEENFDLDVAVRTLVSIYSRLE
jgi:glycosyltransferase involved in cell wall biosynthesis